MSKKMAWDEIGFELRARAELYGLGSEMSWKLVYSARGHYRGVERATEVARYIRKAEEISLAQYGWFEARRDGRRVWARFVAHIITQTGRRITTEQTRLPELRVSALRWAYTSVGVRARVDAATKSALWSPEFRERTA